MFNISISARVKSFKSMSAYGQYLLILSSIILASCSGGDAASPGTNNPSARPLDLDADNAVDVATLSLVETEALAEAIYIIMEEFDTSPPSVGIDVTNCTDGGTETTEFRDNDNSMSLTSGDNIIGSDAACQEGTAASDGEIRINLLASTNPAANRYVGEFIFESTVFSLDGIDVTFDGGANFEVEFFAGIATFLSVNTLEGGITISVGASGSPSSTTETITIRDLERGINASGDLLLDMAVEFESETLGGTFTLATGSNLLSLAGEAPSAGNIILGGDDNSAIRITGNSGVTNPQTNIAIDEDGNGSFEIVLSPPLTWVDIMGSGFLVGLP